MKKVVLLKDVLLIILAGAIGGIVTLAAYVWLGFDKKIIRTFERTPYTAHQVRFSSLAEADSINQAFRIGFSEAAESSLKQVVHIRSSARVVQSNPQLYFFYDPFFRDFFGDRFHGQPYSPQAPEQRREGAGSGVIISPDGYIVTNNHVIDGADEVEVSLHDRRTYTATVVGTDPSTDLALIKINEKNLPYAMFGNSDEVKVGDWVLAVGNPFNLSSTVTAGIISAKARNIHILPDSSAIESFIQTDAAVNPGNSGGALVNVRGELIGINTAIATPTGTYAGYSFAVPSNLVSKVVEDLMKHGMVQRAYLGVMIRDMNGKLAKELDLEISEGVLIDKVVEKGAADQAGVKEKDVIVKIDNRPVRTTAQVLETIARKRPGDQVKLLINRQGKEKELNIKLRGAMDSEAMAQSGKSQVFESLGVVFEDLTAKERKSLNLDGGVKVSKIYPGVVSRYTSIREGFIITKVDNEPVKDLQDLRKRLSGRSGGILIEGIYPDEPQKKQYYGFGMPS